MIENLPLRSSNSMAIEPQNTELIESFLKIINFPWNSFIQFTCRHCHSANGKIIEFTSVLMIEKRQKVDKIYVYFVQSFSFCDIFMCRQVEPCFQETSFFTGTVTFLQTVIFTEVCRQVIPCFEPTTSFLL